MWSTPRAAGKHPSVFITLSKILDLGLEPLTWALLLLAAALLLRPRGRLAGGLVAAAAAVLVLFSLSATADRLMRFAESSAPRTFRPGARYDAVIVLGGVLEQRPSTLGGEGPEMTSAADRITRALELLRTGQARNVLISGGAMHPQPGEPVEAEELSALLQAWGVPAEQIAVEPRSRNTRENAVESARIVAERGWREVLLVTSAAHMPRALGCFRRAGLSPDALPVDYRSGDGGGERWLPRAMALQKSTEAIRELAGRVVYRVAGYTAE